MTCLPIVWVSLPGSQTIPGTLRRVEGYTHVGGGGRKEPIPSSPGVERKTPVGIEADEAGRSCPGSQG